MLTHRRSSAKASSLPTILMTPISTKKIKKNRFNYGGGAAALKHVEVPILTPNKDWSSYGKCSQCCTNISFVWGFNASNESC
ncbi:uncharacterized protein LOC128041377 isoform X2 [Gossypium raimondii]|uniref:uncharacterized protein LOC128041377 isoform X2 n=1 Tax=Gossypium raimondii TaxID=29730 RepID=UPI00227AA95E|nr:uncharacterized protein LOC128041377 isoform X2 [Gossypium raimondii]